MLTSLLLIILSSLLVLTTPNTSSKSMIVYPLSSTCKECNYTSCVKRIAILDPITLDSITLDVGRFSPTSVRMSPRGDQIAFASGSNNREYIYIVDIKTRIQAKLTEITENLVYLSWSHNGSYLAYTTSASDPGSGEKLYIVEQNGRNRKQIGQGLPIFGGIGWSPTEEKLAFATRAGHDELSGIYVYDLKHDEITQIDASINFNTNPAWSPDGSQIAFDSDRNGSRQIYAVDLQSGDVSQVTEETDGAVAPYWAFGRKYIVYYLINHKDFYFKMIELETKTIIPIPMTGNVGSADISPDGDEMVYVVKALPDSRLCIIDLQDMSERCLDENPFMNGDPEWVSLPAD